MYLLFHICRTLTPQLNCGFPLTLAMQAYNFHDKGMLGWVEMAMGFYKVPAPRSMDWFHQRLWVMPLCEAKRKQLWGSTNFHLDVFDPLINTMIVIISEILVLNIIILHTIFCKNNVSCFLIWPSVLFVKKSAHQGVMGNVAVLQTTSLKPSNDAKVKAAQTRKAKILRMRG